VRGTGTNVRVVRAQRRFGCEMARQESDREDLMREATALQRRVQLLVPDDDEPIVCGFRQDGSLSLYFGSDPVYHFDAVGRLKRAFATGFLYRSTGRTLARLQRIRSQHETTLARTDLTADELATFRERTARRLNELCASHSAGRIEIVEAVPGGEDMLPDVVATIKNFLQQGVPLAPPFFGRE